MKYLHQTILGHFLTFRLIEQIYLFIIMFNLLLHIILTKNIDKIITSAYLLTNSSNF